MQKQNDSHEIKVILVSMLSLAIGNVAFDGDEVPSDVRTALTGLLILFLGSKLGFTEEELTKAQDNQEIREQVTNLINNLWNSGEKANGLN